MPYGNLYLIRHAQSRNNAKPEHERIPDPGITEIGVEQSELLAPAIQSIAPDHLYCSPFLRSLQTTEPVSKLLRKPAVVRQDIYEQGGCYQGHQPGELQPVRGKSRSEIAALYPNWQLDERIVETGWNDNTCYETKDMARARAKVARLWFENELGLHSKQTTALVIHADFILRMLEAFFDIEDIDSYLHDPANTSVTCLSREQGRWKLRYFNSFHHLPDHLITY